jgi:transglutaminase-like putative cysteine protease
MSESIKQRLQIYFATLTVLGGIVLAIGNDQSAIPVIAISFAVCGYLFVDRWQLFALPPTAAYFAMVLAAIFCMANFLQRDGIDQRQLLAIAQLLVLVQAILMLQRKSKRVFEQLGIFCLLELIVAAVFNHELSFGLLLIPMTIIGGLALGLLAASSTVQRSELVGPSPILFTTGTTTTAAIDAAAGYSRLALLMVAPSILLFAAVFFYALPRTIGASRQVSRGNAMIGFSDQVRLEQIGQMLSNPEIVLRMKLSDLYNGQPYLVKDGIYLRGQVLDHYQSQPVDGVPVATWNAAESDFGLLASPLPAESFPRPGTDSQPFDRVRVSVDCASLRSSSLFAVAPYYRLDHHPEVWHLADRWTLRRPDSSDWNYPRIEYNFGTNAFFDGNQTDLIPSVTTRRESGGTIGGRWLEFDAQRMPTVAAIGAELAVDSTGRGLSQYEQAKSMERHFWQSSHYRYTLRLQATPIDGLDPIEQFMAVDQQGNCQYFASALVMMLRSQGIPARMVVGYHTHEYNQWSNQYVARQLHAHAWVEALIAADQLTDHADLDGRQPSDRYWVRLDPTPAANRDRSAPGIIRQSIDLAENLWQDNVIDMDADRQPGPSYANRNGVSNAWYDAWYDAAVTWIGDRSPRGAVGGFGDWWARNRFIVASLALASVLIALLSGATRRLFRWRWSWSRSEQVRTMNGQPKIQFYRGALAELARLDIHRRASQTPDEFAVAASDKLTALGIGFIGAPLERLTATFYRQRYGGDVELPNAGSDADVAAIRDGVQQVLHTAAHPKDNLQEQPNQ